MKLKIIFLLFLFSISGCGKSREGQERCFKETKFLMNTLVNITVYTQDKKNAEDAISSVFDEIQRVENVLSRFRRESELYELNKNAQRSPVKVSKELFYVLKECIVLSSITYGMYDITVGPLIDLWGFNNGKPDKKKPDKEYIDKVLKLVGYENLILNEKEHTLKFKKKGMKVDLGSAGKGYAVDMAVEILRKYRIKDFLVDIGGNVYVSGRPAKRKNWNIGVRHPRSNNQILTVLKISNRGIATSGDYENYFIENGIRYHHLINPKTGFPQNKCISVTVVAENAFKADMLSTALFLLGSEEGIKFIESYGNCEYIFVEEKDKGIKVITSKGLSGKIKIRDLPDG